MKMHACTLHGNLLFIRHRRVRINTEQERKECENKSVPLRFGHSREIYFQAGIDSHHRPAVSGLKFRQSFRTAVRFHFIMIHGQEF